MLDLTCGLVAENSSTSFVHLNTYIPSDNGGASISSLRLYRDDPPTTTSISVLITELTSPSLFEAKDPTVSSGRVYRYQTIAVNSEGVESPRSAVATLIAASPPGKPDSVKVVYHSRSALHVVWQQPAYTGGSDIFKFTLYMDDGLGGSRVVVYEGPTTYKEFTGLESGLQYAFQVSATNVVGEGELSEVAIFKTVADPGPPGKPFVLSTDCALETLELGWAPPEDDGGCEIEKYAVYEYSTQLVELAGSATTALTTSVTITGRNCTSAGGPWLFMVRAKNCEDWSVNSLALYTRNADLPGPVEGLSAEIMDVGTIRYIWTALDWTVAGVGSEAVEVFKGYELWGDDGLGGPFNLVYNGFNKPNTRYYLRTGLVLGRTYRAYVLGVNIVGKSSAEVSNKTILYTLMAYRPSPPVNVTTYYHTNTCVAVTWDPSSDDGGSPMNYYQLNYAAEALNVTWTDASMPYGANWLNTTVCGLSEGVTYQFRVRGVNLVNITGEWSALVSRLVGKPPIAAPLNLRRRSSTMESIVWEWDALSSVYYGGASMVSYQLFVNKGYNDEPTLVFDGSLSPNTRTYNSTALVCGLVYKAQVAAQSSIGVGPESPSVSVQLAVPPGPPQGLVLVSSSADHIKVAWEAPVDTGCAGIEHYKVERDCGSGFTVLNSTWSSVFYNDSAVPGVSGSQCVYRIAARNQALTDWGPYSTYVSGFTATVPGMPTGVGVTATGRTTCSLKWTAPSYDGGSAVMNYDVYIDDGHVGSFGRAQLESGLVTIITGLSQGLSYRIKVAAVNVVGTGNFTVPISCVAADLAGPPLNLKGTSAGDGMVRVEWEQPVDDGGAYLLGYRVIVNGTCTIYSSIIDPATTVAILPCEEGVLYKLTATAYTQVGWGANSTAVDFICVEPPGAPTGLGLNYNEEMGALDVRDLRSRGLMSLHWEEAVRASSYRLYIDDGSLGGLFALAYEGTESAYVATGLQDGSYYRWKVGAVNGGGQGPNSTAFTALMRCVPVAPSAAPTKTAGSPWTLDVGGMRRSMALKVFVSDYVATSERRLRLGRVGLPSLSRCATSLSYQQRLPETSCFCW